MPFAIPKSHLINSYRQAGGTALHWLLAEAVDNSFDWGANEVVIRVDAGSDQITIVDNGLGITKDRIVAPITLGDHQPSTTKGLARFGVGITAQAMKHGDILEVETVSSDGRGSIIANWPQMLRQDWYYQDPLWRPVLSTTPTGTTITISRLVVRLRPKDIEKAHEEIALRFFPALAVGHRIILNGLPIPFLTEPLLTDVIQCTLSFDDGRVAKVRAGMLKNPDASGLRRVHVSYLHRVIIPNSSFGTEGYSGIENMFARVELSEHWKLTQYKDSVDDADELEERLNEALQPILEKCHAHSMTVDLQNTIDAVYELMGDAAARPIRKKPRRPPGPPQPPTPPSPIKIVSSATPSNTGPVKKSQARNRLKIEFPGGKDDADRWGLGSVDRQGRVHCVLMPRENPEIKDMLAERDLAKRAKAIHRHVALLYIQSNPQQDIEGFGKLAFDFLLTTRISSSSSEVA